MAKYLIMYVMAVLMALSSVYTDAAMLAEFVQLPPKQCKICDSEKCPDPGFCPAGIALDECGCCQVCGLEEGQLCNYSPSINDEKVWHGYCGTGMECKKRMDIDKSKVKEQSVCVCETKGYICGSDKKTYSYCKFWAEKQRHQKNGLSELKEIHKNPCLTDPQILSISESKGLSEGSKHTLICEIYGYPLPKIEWYFKSIHTKEEQRMPGFDSDITTSERGGPEEMKLTGYLQFTNFQYKHEGIYTCQAIGSQGEASQVVSMVLIKSKPIDL